MGPEDGRLAVDCVVGSGPSGVACAAALLKRGRRVQMLDAGVELEAERARVVDALRGMPSTEWDPATLEQLTNGERSRTAIPDKLVFGSRYPYKEVEEHIGQVRDGVGLRASLALGGLSNVWGAAMLPVLEQDIDDWPIRREQLTSHYEAVAQLAKPCGGDDDLARLFPLYSGSPGTLQLSRQAQALWTRLEAHRGTLREAGIHFGRARLAIQLPGESFDAGCTYCAQCMNGCPYGHIYSTAKTVAELRRCERFSYHPGIVVRTLREAVDHVTVKGHHLATRAPFEGRAERVYLAAGAIPTTGILLRSLGVYDRPLAMKDSQYFLLPLVMPRGVPGVRHERLHTLSQIFMEVIDPAVSRHAIHLQIYSYCDPIGRALRRAMGHFARPLEFLARGLEERILLVQGFAHSADSSEISVTLRRGSGPNEDGLYLKAVPHARATRVVRKVARKLLQQAPRLGAVQLPLTLEIAEPGRSFHSGGTFPMRTNPGTFETDSWGRPAGWRRVHAVDATILPSVPGTTITFTVMANAHRIAWETAGAT